MHSSIFPRGWESAKRGLPAGVHPVLEEACLVIRFQSMIIFYRIIEKVFYKIQSALFINLCLGVLGCSHVLHTFVVNTYMLYIISMFTVLSNLYLYRLCYANGNASIYSV